MTGKHYFKREFVITALLALLQFALLTAILLLDIQFKDALPDYIAFWPAGRLVLEGNYNLVYDIESIIDVQRTVVPGLQALIMHVHPPFFLFFTTPLAYFDFYTSCLIWLAITSCFYGYACWRIFPNRYAVLLSIFFPPFIISFSMVQTGAICMFFFAGGFLLFRGAPWKAGLCLSLLLIKPHLGILIPVALLASRQWKIIGATILWTGFLFVVTLLFFDLQLWFDWYKIIRYIGELYLSSTEYNILHYQSFFGFLQFLECPIPVAWGVQFVIGLINLAIIVFVWSRDGFCYETRIGVLVAATFMVSPYIMMYDHTMMIVGYLVLARYFLDEKNLTSKTAILFALSVFCETLILMFRLPAGFFGAMFMMIAFLLPENRKVCEERLSKTLR